MANRRKLWAFLIQLKSSFTALWCIGGDLNEIRYKFERQGCSNKNVGMQNFNKFIEDMELFDLPTLKKEKNGVELIGS